MSVNICESPDGWLRANAEALDNLVQSNGIETVTAAATAGQNSGVILADATIAAFILTLPKVADVQTGKILTIKKMDAGGNNVTVDGDGAETIDNGATVVLSATLDYVTLISDGSEWWIISEIITP